MPNITMDFIINAAHTTEINTLFFMKKINIFITRTSRYIGFI
ncbi:hypothetical protein PPBDW_I20799 [Photobacterium kishitanii]|nr:hypothetical protein PPBDW_I20799 [Photobacterium kishitanii]